MYGPPTEPNWIDLEPIAEQLEEGVLEELQILLSETCDISDTPPQPGAYRRLKQAVQRMPADELVYLAEQLHVGPQETWR